MKFQWNHKRPVSFQDWSNIDYGPGNASVREHVYERRYTISIQVTNKKEYDQASSRAKTNHYKGCRIEGYGQGSFVTDVDFMCRNKEENKELDTVIKQSFEVLQPSSESSKQCVMLLVLNLAEPQWIQVPCYQPLLYTTVCSKRRRQKVNITQQLGQPNCPKYSILINSTCYIFLHLTSRSTTNIQTTVHLNCKKYSMVPSVLDKTFKFETIFTAIEFTRLSLLSIHPLYMKLLVYEKVWMKIVTKQKNININDFSHEDVHHVCERSAGENHNIANYGNIVQCRNGRLISSFYFCSMDRECANDQLEMDIINGESPTSSENSANSFSCVCSFLFYKFYKGGCNSYINLNVLTEIIDLTRSDKWINDHDGIPNDEPIYITSKLQCKKPDQLPCKPGSSTCFNFSSICIYRLSSHSILIPCETGSHLQECRNFECNLHFKCHGHYCIPLGYHCDGKWDCPFGDDEKNCSQRHCCRMFKCVKSQICLHIGDICDGYNDCPWNDDELMCTLMGTICPEKCKCLNFGIICTNVSVNVQTISNLPHVSVHVTQCKIKLMPNLNLNHDIIVLNLSTNAISAICGEQIMKSLTILDLSCYQIMFITKSCFDSMERLMILRLQNNRIEKIEENGFHKLPSLLILDLSNNKLSTFSKNVFVNITQLSLLILHNNPFTGLFVTMFVGLDNKLILTNNYKICCLAYGKTVNCISKKYLNEACHTQILDSEIIAASVHVLIIIVLNIFSIFLNSRQKDGPLKIIIDANGVINTWCSFYLIVILGMDTYYGDSFLIYESQWRSSIFCVAAFVIILNYHFVSIYLALLLSFGRLMVVLYPLGSKFKVKHFVSQRLIIGVSTLGFLSVSAGWKLKFSDWKSPSILCLPFIDPHSTSLVVKLLTVVLLFIKISSVLSIIGMYTYMVQHIKRVNKIIQITSQRDTFPVVIQVISLTVSYFISWIVPSAVYLVCLFLKFYPKDTLGWITVTIVPIKCIMDPIIFIIVARRKNRNKREGVHER